jgi:hypothetical protein
MNEETHPVPLRQRLRFFKSGFGQLYPIKLGSTVHERAEVRIGAFVRSDSAMLGNEVKKGPAASSASAKLECTSAADQPLPFQAERASSGRVHSMFV